MSGRRSELARRTVAVRLAFKTKNLREDRGHRVDLAKRFARARQIVEEAGGGLKKPFPG